MKGNRGGGRRYDPLDHDQRAAFSSYLQGLRLRASLSQMQLADDADVDAKAPVYFEAHPAEPLACQSRRRQLSKICQALAGALGEDPAILVARAGVLGGGLSDGSPPGKPTVPARLGALHSERLDDSRRIAALETAVAELQQGDKTGERLGRGLS